MNSGATSHMVNSKENMTKLNNLKQESPQETVEQLLPQNMVTDTAGKTGQKNTLRDVNKYSRKTRPKCKYIHCGKITTRGFPSDVRR